MQRFFPFEILIYVIYSLELGEYKVSFVAANTIEAHIQS